MWLLTKGPALQAIIIIISFSPEKYLLNLYRDPRKRVKKF